MRERSLYGGCQRREPGGESGGECLSGQYLSCGWTDTSWKSIQKLRQWETE